MQELEFIVRVIQEKCIYKHTVADTLCSGASRGCMVHKTPGNFCIELLDLP